MKENEREDLTFGLSDVGEKGRCHDKTSVTSVIYNLANKKCDFNIIPINSVEFTMYTNPIS